MDIAEPSVPKETVSSPSQPVAPSEPSPMTKPLLCSQPVATAAVPSVTAAAQVRHSLGLGFVFGFLPLFVS